MKLILLFVLVSVVTCIEKSEIVNVKEGKLRGVIQQSYGGREYAAFMGVPYAKPPLGPLRFKPTEPVEPWDGVYEAFEPIECLQQDLTQDYLLIGTENCLHLNVYTNALSKKDKLLPVLLWIHGGGFMWGAGAPRIYGPNYFMDRDIVLVTINYRIGALGFLSTGDTVCPGNNGLKDQTMALKWTNKNIQAFGGDPNSITIFGLSAGGASVHYHMLSPMSRGLFHKAISQSGSSLNSWAYVEPDLAEKRGKMISEFLKCPTESSEEMVECLRNKDAEEIVQQHSKFLTFGMDPITAFGPTVEVAGEDRFLPEEPFQLMFKGKFADIPWIVGQTAQEGVYGSAVVFGDIELQQRLRDHPLKELPLTLDFQHSTDDPKLLAELIMKYYYGNRPIGRETATEMKNMYGDRQFFHGIYEALRTHAIHAKEPIYWYQFNFANKNSSIGHLLSHSKEFFGICHADDLQYIFDGPEWPLIEGDGVAISNILLSYWENFAKTGNPTPITLEWETIKPDNMEYMDITLKPTMKKEFPHDRMAFWSSLPLKEAGHVCPSTGECIKTRTSYKDEL